MGIFNKRKVACHFIQRISFEICSLKLSVKIRCSKNQIGFTKINTKQMVKKGLKSNVFTDYY